MPPSASIQRLARTMMICRPFAHTSPLYDKRLFVEIGLSTREHSQEGTYPETCLGTWLASLQRLPTLSRCEVF